MDFVSDLRDATLDAASAIGFAAKEIWQTNRGYIGVSVQNAQSFSDSNKH